MYNLLKKLYPLCRSLTGDGVRQTLAILQEHIPLEIKNISSGNQVFDWKVPKEWNIRDAYVKNSKGERIIDFQKSNLHVLNYSIPVNARMTLEQLRPHLFTNPKYPDWIPYLSSYYKEHWGFCLSHNQYVALEEDTYEVVIDSSLTDGNLVWGEYFIQGQSNEEVLLSTYICHPSTCNDNLSGIVLNTWLAKALKEGSHYYSYRFLFIPETIGAIAWLALNEEKLSLIHHGLIITCVGDSGSMTYKKSRLGNADIDKAVAKILSDSGDAYKIQDYDPCGSDERQFCSPGINLPMGSLMRTQYGHYPEYHTSADNLDFVKPEALDDSFQKYCKVLDLLEHNNVYINTNPKCEPQLGKRGLYRLIGGSKDEAVNELAIGWVLNFSDGSHSLLDIAIRSGISFDDIKKAADALIACQLLRSQNENKKYMPAVKSSNLSETSF